jgi:nicotinamidase-related amidase
VAADRSALVVIDVLNPYDHDDAGPLAESMRAVVAPISGLVRRACDEDVPVIYVNDNYGDWTLSMAQIADNAVSDGSYPELVEPLLPPAGANLVVKARHSAFYQTPLEYLLGQFGVTRVVLCGQVTEQCILYSALDAYVRHLEVGVPVDAVAHIDDELARAALRMMRRNMRADVEPAARCVL